MNEQIKISKRLAIMADTCFTGDDLQNIQQFLANHPSVNPFDTLISLVFAFTESNTKHDIINLLIPYLNNMSDHQKVELAQDIALLEETGLLFDYLEDIVRVFRNVQIQAPRDYRPLAAILFGMRNPMTNPQNIETGLIQNGLFHSAGDYNNVLVKMLCRASGEYTDESILNLAKVLLELGASREVLISELVMIDLQGLTNIQLLELTQVLLKDANMTLLRRHLYIASRDLDLHLDSSDTLDLIDDEIRYRNESVKLAIQTVDTVNPKVWQPLGQFLGGYLI